MPWRTQGDLTGMGWGTFEKNGQRSPREMTCELRSEGWEQPTTPRIEGGHPEQREEHTQRPWGGNDLGVFKEQKESQCDTSIMDISDSASRWRMKGGWGYEVTGTTANNFIKIGSQWSDSRKQWSSILQRPLWQLYREQNGLKS